MIKIKQVTGMYYNDMTKTAKIKKLTVRLMQDNKGKSLSIADEQEGIMLEIPLEPVLKELKGKKR